MCNNVGCIPTKALLESVPRARQNLVLSVVVSAVLVVGAVAGVFTLPIAILGHELSEFVVIASGLRMLRA